VKPLAQVLSGNLPGDARQPIDGRQGTTGEEDAAGARYQQHIAFLQRVLAVFRLERIRESAGTRHVDTPQGPRYTRLGRFQLDAEGKLVTSEGHAVRGAGGAIFIPAEDGEVVVASDGTVSTEGGPIDRLSVVRFADEQELRKVSGGLYESDATPLPNLEAEIAQGMVEESNVRPVVELTLMMSVMRNFQAAQRMIETQDELQRRVINTIVSSA